MSSISSQPYRPDSTKCCQACVFGRGQHEYWCPHGIFFAHVTGGVLVQHPILCKAPGCKSLVASYGWNYCLDHALRLNSAV